MGRRNSSKRKQTKRFDAKTLFHVFKNNSNRFFRKKQLLRYLPKGTPEVELFYALDSLVKEGKIFKTPDKKYRFSEKQYEKQEAIIQGKVDMSASGTAYILIDGMDQDIMVEKTSTKGALQGDLVEVAITKPGKHKIKGVILRIVERARHEFPGILQLGPKTAFVVPDRKNIPYDVFIPKGKTMNAQNGDKVMVSITRYDERMKNPEGKIIRVLGKPGDHEVEMASILLDHGIEYDFPQAVLDELALIDDEISEKEIRARHDIRDVLTFTIDPHDAKDFDDALSYRKLENGNYEVGIHIADVTHYLEKGTALDQEAYDRATSVYLVDRTIPMLPERLSNFLCSLRPNEDKLCYSAIFELSPEAEIKEQWFGRTVIHSDRRFTYEEAQEVIESKQGDFADELTILNTLSKKMRKQRSAEGAISFETIEVKFKLDENKKPIGIYFKERKDAHMLIEDFMLLANKRVARYIADQSKSGQVIPFAYRVHDLPDEEKLLIFKEYAESFGHIFTFNSATEVADALNKLMDQIKGKPEQNVLEQLAIRSMSKAIYTTDNIGHFGLGFKYYGHFTSPIRRYPDVMVHRVLDDVLNGRKVISKSDLEARCLHCSAREKTAAAAERDSIKFKQVEFMEDHLGEDFEGIISGITSWGVFVEIIETKCEGMVPLKDMGNDWNYEDGKMRLVNHRSGKKLHLGSKLKVKIVKTDLARKTIDLDLVNIL